jgi:hypothetical protein
MIKILKFQKRTKSTLKISHSMVNLKFQMMQHIYRTISVQVVGDRDMFVRMLHRECRQLEASVWSSSLLNFADDQFRGDEMGRACGTYGGQGECVEGFGESAEERVPRGSRM